MKHFKKKTIALVLASVVTVVGSFAANSYQNSLMGLSFEPTTSGNVNMIVQTKSAYNGNVTPVKKDANTFVLMLPEMNSFAPTPDLSKVSNITVNIRTMPYSNNAKGYTKITIKTTSPSMLLSGHNQVFIPDSTKTPSNATYVRQETPSSEQENYAQQQEMLERELERQRRLEEEAERLRKEQERQQNMSYSNIEEPYSTTQRVIEEVKYDEEAYEDVASPVQEKTQEHSYYLIWAILIILGSAFFYIKAKNKMIEIAGERLEIDVDEAEKTKPEENARKKLSKIKKTINTLDNAYSKTSGLLGTTSYNQIQQPAKKLKPAEELNVVDLDQLFKEQKAKSTEEIEAENEALEEFLSGFSFDEELYEAEQKENAAVYDEEFYNKIISDKNIVFSKNDINCIKQLLNSEINDETMRNIDNFVATSPIKPPSKKEILENLVTSYTISQNITFTKDDIDALYKIINVEIDQDFVTDLRTNPNRVAEMRKDILDYGDKPKKPSKVITLSVSDMLPNLSEALKQQGNKKIESKHKAETVYYSEGYDVKTLSLSEDLPDLTRELNKQDAYTSKPSARYDIVDTNYTVGDNELKISSELPDLQDALAHPEKYSKPEEEEVVVDEQALLNNIANVQFKPFDDGTRNFEVINNFDEIPSVDDIQKEFSQFDSFEITEEEQISPKTEEDYDDFKALYNNEYVDLDNKKISNTGKGEENNNTEFVPAKLDCNVNPVKRERKSLPESILKRINESRNERRNNDSNRKNEKKSIETVPSRCILEGESFVVVSSTILVENKGCYLVKNEKGYAVIGYIGDSLTKIKEYTELKSEKIQSRLSEKLSDGTQRFLIRIGINKFIVDVDSNNIRYVMDLC